ncbi:unnamed protein product [Meloidogyne enterolobii]|uniref:Uncharacterized protein n=1 Tax=Meloidogyne enterolobii TaxID=390850 RepID=A0ACB0ZNH3_MELEN
MNENNNKNSASSSGSEINILNNNLTTNIQHSLSGSALEFNKNNLFGDGLQFVKITERIFAILFHSGSDAIYRNNIKAISERLKKTFLDKYKIFNLSQKRSDLGRANQQGNVLEFGWPEPLAPPLDRLCSICKQLENHLNCSKENVAVIHCKGGIYRAGIVIAAFMNYTNICAGEENLPDRFSMKLFTEKYMEINTQPSHKRYVNYFINLLTGTTKVYPSPIFLLHISLSKLFSGQTVKLKLYERMKPIWSSGKIILKEYTLIEMPGNKQSLRGDVLLKCYQSTTIINNNINEKQLLFQCQFNTCAIGIECFNIPKIFFTKIELDCLNNCKNNYIILCIIVLEFPQTVRPPYKIPPI